MAETASVQLPAPCSCDDSKHWQLRALAAEAKNRALELALKFARQQLNRLLDRLDGVIREQLDVDPSEERVAGTWGETVIASGTQAPASVGARLTLPRIDPAE